MRVDDLLKEGVGGPVISVNFVERGGGVVLSFKGQWDFLC